MYYLYNVYNAPMYFFLKKKKRNTNMKTKYSSKINNNYFEKIMFAGLSIELSSKNKTRKTLIFLSDVVKTCNIT